MHEPVPFRVTLIDAQGAEKCVPVKGEWFGADLVLDLYWDSPDTDVQKLIIQNARAVVVVDAYGNQEVVGKHLFRKTRVPTRDGRFPRLA